jgi:hypothetical protein
VHIGCEGLFEEPECGRRIAGLKVTECEMPIEVAPQGTVARISGEPRHDEFAGPVRVALLIAEMGAGVRRPGIFRILGERSIDLWGAASRCPFSESAIP